MPSKRIAFKPLNAPDGAPPVRLPATVDVETPPRLSFAVVGIGGSAGGLEAFVEFFSTMRPDSGMAFVVILHLPPDRHSRLTEILSQRTTMLVRDVEDGMPVKPNEIYVIRPGRTLTIKGGLLHLGEPLEARGHRHPVDDFFRSLAEEQRERAIGIVMSGTGSNGTQGAHTIKAVGGICIAQSAASAKFTPMPQSLIDAGLADFVLKPAEMPEILERYSQHPYATGQALPTAKEGADRYALNEILTLLRTRIRHDFTGYKKPTLIRRIERRMGLHQLDSLATYATYLRENSNETVLLSDDLMIHVTGFFRDPEAWYSLQEQVIEELVRSRDGGTIRAWVTACSSGEEAYTLAMIIAEVTERQGRVIQIKIFATDPAERSLAHARLGVYPSAIEADVSPERLERFFDREGSTYRVKVELREMVIFAPQNLLQDPPFSRLDICTCRNLLIYLEPPAQERALDLMHFGLREGGALMLGTSETVSDAMELFEAIDKRHRIFRRTARSRTSSIDFPLLKTAVTAKDIVDNKLRPRPSVGLSTDQALLEHYAPPSVVVDRDFRIVYFHGQTSRFIDQPSGEPTRDVLALATENVRASMRTAMHRSMATGDVVRITGKWASIENGRRTRVTVRVAPLDPVNIDQLFLVSFDEETDAELALVATDNEHVDYTVELTAELRGVRDELQSTVRELQISNEEMKAAHEEATSINEEMQSTNEELETSREELQSLNEELITVNTQLQRKMEQLEGSTNDLGSLLSSTSIAVIFLDPSFNIRRFTPAISDLIDLIPADVGRPLSDLSRKFDDDNLLADANTVLTHLSPLEREVESRSGRAYMRRILPYRTTDNRIEGVVITFVDITERSRAERALKEREEQQRLILQGLKEYGMLNTVGNVITWTHGAETLFRYTASEAAGKHLSDFIPEGEDGLAVAARELHDAATNGVASQEGWRVRKGGVRFWADGMLAALRDGNGKLLGFVKVVRDNTDRKLSEEALKQAKRAAESANDAKDSFLANVSHEMRTPLSAILLWTNLIRDQENVPPEQLAHALTAINRSAEEQRELIEDLVDTSRIAAGKLVLDRKGANLAAVVRGGVDSAMPLALTKKVNVALDIDASIDNVLIDASLLHQVVNNLVGNAIKFTPPGGKVEVSLRRLGDEVEFIVRDNGIGITPEFLPHVFDRFSQERDSRTRNNNGLGLGLAIVRYVVESHGGTVEADSGGVGLGTTVTVRLILPALLNRLLEVEASGTRQMSGMLLGIRVLLIEDVEETRLALEAVLQLAQAKVVSTSTGAAALDAYQSPDFDVILSDLGLPDIDGFEVIANVRRIEKTHNRRATPAIAFTAFANQNIKRKALERGFQLCLTKPIQPLELVQAMAQLTRTTENARKHGDA